MGDFKEIGNPEKQERRSQADARDQKRQRERTATNALPLKEAVSKAMELQKKHDATPRNSHEKAVSELNRASIDRAFPNAIKHLSKVTERGEHKPHVGGFKDHNHSGDK
jgi:hypothetical protein